MLRKLSRAELTVYGIITVKGFYNVHNELNKWAKLWPIFPLKQSNFLPKHEATFPKKHITRTNIKRTDKNCKGTNSNWLAFFSYFLFHHKT